MTAADEVGVVKARLESAVLTVYDTAPTATTYPYVVLYGDGGVRSSDRESDVRVQRSLTLQTTTVGKSVAQCRAALVRVNDSLEDWTPALAGRVFAKVEHTGSQPIKADESLPDRVLFYATDQWRVVSDPA